jgi:hypothetical protein
MGLDMKDKKKVCEKIARRYQKADKKGKGKLLDEYTVTLEYNRDYLAHPNSKNMLYYPHGTGNHQRAPKGPAGSGGGAAG